MADPSFSCAAKIWRDDGIAGFCAGMVPRVSYIAPSVVIFFIVYEQVQQRLSTVGPAASVAAPTRSSKTTNKQA
jgi:hypothetical protein